MCKKNALSSVLDKTTEKYALKMILDNSTLSESGHKIPTSVKGHRRIGKYRRKFMLGR